MERNNPLDAGWDLRAAQDTIVYPGHVTTVYTGVHVDIPQGHVGLVCSRSGLAAKYGVFVLNSPGIIDSGFSGDVGVILTKMGADQYPIRTGDRIAQLVVVPLSAYTPGLISDRGDKGFGSSGVA